MEHLFAGNRNEKMKIKKKWLGMAHLKNLQHSIVSKNVFLFLSNDKKYFDQMEENLYTRSSKAIGINN